MHMIELTHSLIFVAATPFKRALAWLTFQVNFTMPCFLFFGAFNSFHLSRVSFRCGFSVTPAGGNGCVLLSGTEDAKNVNSKKGKPKKQIESAHE